MVQNDKEGTPCVNPAIRRLSNSANPTGHPLAHPDAYPNALIYECGAHGIRELACEDTEHYRVTRDFLANPSRMLRVLMGEE